MEQKRLLLLAGALIVGGVIGYLVRGGTAGQVTAQPSPSPEAKTNLPVNIYDPEKLYAEGLKEQREDFKFSILADTPTGSVEVFQIDGEVKMHVHERENHFLYVLSGQAEGIIVDTTATVVPGQLIQIPAGVPHAVRRVGNEPFRFILFSTPPFRADDIKWVEESPSPEAS